MHKCPPFTLAFNLTIGVFCALSSKSSRFHMSPVFEQYFMTIDPTESTEWSSYQEILDSLNMHYTAWIFRVT